jgi:hypothetical protein
MTFQVSTRPGRPLLEFAEQRRDSRIGKVGWKAPATAKGQQILEGHRALHGDEVVNERRRCTKNLRSCEFGQPVGHGRIGFEAAVVNQHHDCGGDDSTSVTHAVFEICGSDPRDSGAFSPTSSILHELRK